MNFTVLLEVTQLDGWRESDYEIDSYHADVARWKRMHLDMYGTDYDPAYYTDVRVINDTESIPDGWVQVTDWLDIDSAFTQAREYIPLVVSSNADIDAYINHCFTGE